MNIFTTDKCAELSAYALPNVLVNKMIIESAQLLCTAHHELGSDKEGLYKPTHKNHPSAIWARSSKGNYQWLYSHFKTLGEVYELRSDKVHKTIKKLLDTLVEAPRAIPDSGVTRFTKCMPDNIKNKYIDPCDAYRVYMNVKYREWQGREKPIKLEWTLDIPNWVCEDIVSKIVK